MRPQWFISPRALCLLVLMAHAFCGGSASNTTTSRSVSTGQPTAEYSTMTTENIFLTTLPTSSATFTTHGSKPRSMSTISTVSKDVTKPTTASTSTASPESSKTGTIVCLIFFICFILVLLFCAYKWYVHHGRPSFPEIWRTVTETARNLWALALECLSESSKREEADEEMEAGIAEAEERKQQEEDAENDNKDDGDNSSDDYSSIDEAVMKKEPEKGDDDEDRRSNERADDDDDDMSSVELKDEKREKDDLTVL
ncbi:uncharacterized protein Hap1MRO34_022529 [Clarias gariepinus]